MSSEGVFVIADDGRMMYVEGISDEEFVDSVGSGNVMPVGVFDGEEFVPQAWGSSLVKTGASLVSGVAKTIYKTVYRYTGEAEKIAVAGGKVTSPEKLLSQATAEMRNVGKISEFSGSKLATGIDKTMLSKSAELEAAVTKARAGTDLSRVLAAGETGEIANAKKALAELDAVLADQGVAKAISASEKNVLLTSRASLKDSLAALEKPQTYLTDTGVKTARDQIVAATEKASTTLDDAAKFRMNNWSVLKDEIVGVSDDAALKLARERAVAEDFARSLEKETAEVAAKSEAGMFSKLTGAVTSSKAIKYGLVAGVGLTAISATVGIVSAAGIGGKAGDTTKTPGEDPAIVAVRDQACGSVSDWEKAGVADPAGAREMCRSCIVTGKETEEDLTACLKGKLGGAGAGAGGAGAGGAGGAGEGAGGSGAGDICDDSNLDAETKALCKECQKISSAPQDVELISQCIVDKRASDGKATSDICDSSNLDAETLTFCKACQKEVSDPQDVTLVAECITRKRTEYGAVTGDICEDSGLDAATKAICKTCQGQVTDPQDVAMVSACISSKLGETPLGTTTPCDEAGANLTDEQYLACVDCYKDGMAIADLQDCMIEMLAATAGKVPVCDINDPNYDLSLCLGKICDPADVLFDQAACDYYTGIAEQPYYGTGQTVVDTMDPCDTTSQMFNATECTNLGGEVYTTSIEAEAAPTPLVPAALLAGAAALLVLGFRGSGPGLKKK